MLFFLAWWVRNSPAVTKKVGGFMLLLGPSDFQRVRELN